GRRLTRLTHEHEAAFELRFGRIDLRQLERLAQTAVADEKRERRRIRALVERLLVHLLILFFVNADDLAVRNDAVAVVRVAPAHLPRLFEDDGADAFFRLR